MIQGEGVQMAGPRCWDRWRADQDTHLLVVAPFEQARVGRLGDIQRHCEGVMGALDLGFLVAAPRLAERSLFLVVLSRSSSGEFCVEAGRAPPN